MRTFFINKHKHSVENELLKGSKPSEKCRSPPLKEQRNLDGNETCDMTSSESMSKQKTTRGFFLHYTIFLHSKTGQFTAFTFASVLILFAGIGVFTLQATFEPSKAFPSDSPLSDHTNLRKVFDEAFGVHFFVSRSFTFVHTSSNLYFTYYLSIWG